MNDRAIHRSKKHPEQIRTKKSLGQNFILDDDLLTDLVSHAQITKNDSVLEIGTGLGTLTDILSETAGEVVTIEVDDSLIPALQVRFAFNDRVRLIHADVLKTDLDGIIDSFSGIPKVVANIPYYITTDIIRKLFTLKRLKSVSLLVQKEVAEKMLARPGDKDHALISLLTHYYSEPVFCLDVPRERFHPSPNVDSAFIRLDMDPARRFHANADLERLFLSVCDTLFFMRRKTLLNNLSARFHFDRLTADDILKASGIDPTRRGETLRLEEIYRLTEVLFEYLKKH